MNNKIAFVFAGQGAQYPGMGKSLYENFAPAKAVFDMSERISPGNINMCFEGTPQQLSVTKNTQPALFTTELACALTLKAMGIEADLTAGFSLGEVSALAYADVMDIESAFKFVVERANVMQRCSEENPGGMAAVLKLDNSTVEKLCTEIGDVYPVNYNCPGQIVVAGRDSSLSRFIEAGAAAGGRCVKLAVGGAFHSPLMNKAADSLTDYLNHEKLSVPRIPLYSNTTALPYPPHPTDMTKLIAAQVKKPVLWEDTIRNMNKSGAGIFVEIGPGKVLTGLIKRILPDVHIINADNAKTLIDAVKAVNEVKDA